MKADLAPRSESLLFQDMLFDALKAIDENSDYFRETIDGNQTVFRHLRFSTEHSVRGSDAKHITLKAIFHWSRDHNKQG